MIRSNQLQNSLDLVAAWAENWQLSLSASKCSVMRISSSRLVSVGPAYKVGIYTLPIVSQFTDLGVSYDDHLNFLPHISKIVKKAAGRAKCILKCFASRDKLLLTRAFCTFVRPLLEFSSIIWSPYFKKDIYKIEAVQRSFTKAIGNLRHLSYKDRLINLEIDSLQCRRLKSDLVMCYKMLNGLVDMNCSCFLVRATYSSTRGNSFKLAKLPVGSLRDKNFFSNRIVNIWNSLPDSIVTSSSVSCFKRSIDQFNFCKFLLF